MAAKLFLSLCFLTVSLASPLGVTGAEPSREWMMAHPELDAKPAMDWLKAHRLSEEEFIRAIREPGTVILDASDRKTYKLLHIAGAVHLTGKELESAEAVARILPDKEARILLYENNNYRTVTEQFWRKGSMMSQPYSADNREWSSENIEVYQVLYAHGYRHIYELAPYIRVDRSKLPLVASMSSVDLGQPVALSLSVAP